MGEVEIRWFGFVHEMSRSFIQPFSRNLLSFAGSQQQAGAQRTPGGEAHKSDLLCIISQIRNLSCSFGA